jgi:UDP-N-acetylmuramoylalanine--D-glutamate ligase
MVTADHSASGDHPAFEGMRVTVMGLGLHGGGLNTARFLHDRGARVTVTDLRIADDLKPTLQRLPDGVRLVLGEHREEDFLTADLVVKNPAVPRDAPFLQVAPAITTDIAIFLAEWRRRTGDARGPLVAITGSKGKSSTAGATAAILKATRPGTSLGGNITVSPLEFVDALAPGDPVVLELSSFQLGDLWLCREFNGADGTRHRRGTSAATRSLPREVLLPTLDPEVAIVTTIFPDHQDYYHSMDRYVEDKSEIFRFVRPGGLCIVGSPPEWSERLMGRLTHRPTGEDTVTILRIDQAAPPQARDNPLAGETLNLAGDHMRYNLTLAALACRHLDLTPEQIRIGARKFTGVPHRLETIGTGQGIMIVNDTAATIPEATLAATGSYEQPVILLAGGSDKGLALDPIIEAGRQVVKSGGAVVLLAGSATERLVPLFRDADLPFHGPEDSLREAFRTALKVADRRPPSSSTSASATASPAADGEAPRVVLLLSPGCASFGMFRNEFDRGDQFRELARRFLESGVAP